MEKIVKLNLNIKLENWRSKIENEIKQLEFRIVIGNPQLKSENICEFHNALLFIEVLICGLIHVFWLPREHFWI